MKNVIRWGLAAGAAAALALFGSAQAQSASGSSGASGSSTSRGDTGGATPGGADRSTAGQQTTPQGGAAGTSSDTGMRRGEKGTGSAAAGQHGKVDKGLQDRLERIHATNQAEVQMGQLGAQSAQSPEVKQFAEHMQTDHQKADQKLTETAQSAGISNLQGKEFQKHSDDARKEMEKLQSKSGTDFDKAFMSRMVKDHEKVLKDVEKARDDAKKANQTELASLLEQTHTGIKGHLDHAKQIQQSLGAGGQMRQGRKPAAGGTGAGAPEGGAPGQRTTK